MKRSSFLKALLGLAVAPQIIGDIEFKVPQVAPVKNLLLNDLQSMTPVWYKDLLERYGSENYGLLLEYMGTMESNSQFKHFENSKCI